jgi:choline dehydrogenase-like flavoprotein
MKADFADAVVVGAGASGGIAAKDLAAAGWSVILLERGPWLKTFGHLETRDSWNTGAGRVPFGPDRSELRTVRASDRDRVRIVERKDPLYGALPAVVGGGSVYYGAMAWRSGRKHFACAPCSGRSTAPILRIGRSSTMSSSRSTKKPNTNWA